MSRAPRRSRPSTPRRRPRLERLERRATLSAPDGGAFDGDPPGVDLSPPDFSLPEATLDLAIVATEPAAGSAIDRPTTTIALVFDRPLDPFGIGQGTFNLERLDDGQGVYVFEPGSLVEALDETGTRLFVELDTPLGPGRYRLALAGSAFVGGLDGSFLFGDGTDRPLAEFVVAEAAIPRPDPVAVPLSPGRIASVAGSLDLADELDAVDLYRIELPAGHTWRLGLEVRSQRGGGALDAALALFDADGRPLRTAEFGRADAPRDPYLFAGLAPGIYYVGVSGAGNLPGLPGGYELAAPGRGPADSDQVGGSYVLDLVADPADEPTRLVGFRLDRADPQAGSPSGFVLAFRGSIDASRTLESLGRAVEVVDAEGRAWPARVVDYDEAKATLTYLLDAPLPAGSYAVRVASIDGLTDLAGRPVAGPGRDAAQLATFPVFEPAGLRTAGDLGLMLPAVATAGVERQSALGAGESASFRFVVPRRGFYSLAFESGGAAFEVVLSGADGPVRFGDDSVGDGRLLADLAPGEYRLAIRAGEGGPAVIGFTLRGPAAQRESFLLGGVGQGPAINLRLVSPNLDLGSTRVTTDPGPVGRSPLGPADQPAAPASSFSATPGVDTPEAPGAGAILPEALAAGGTSFFVAAGSADLIGRPTAGGGLVAPVGPGAIGGTALASSNLSGLSGALGFGQGAVDRIATEPRLLGDPDGPAHGFPPIDGGMTPADPADAPPATAERPGLVGRLRDWASGWFESAEAPPAVATTPASIAADPAPVEQVEAEAASSAPDPEAEAARGDAELADRIRTALPWGVGLVAAWVTVRTIRRRRRAAGRRAAAVAAKIARPRPMGLGRVEAGRRERPVVRSID